MLCQLFVFVHNISILHFAFIGSHITINFRSSTNKRRCIEKIQSGAIEHGLCGRLCQWSAYHFQPAHFLSRPQLLIWTEHHALLRRMCRHTHISSRKICSRLMRIACIRSNEIKNFVKFVVHKTAHLLPLKGFTLKLTNVDVNRRASFLAYPPFCIYK